MGRHRRRRRERESRTCQISGCDDEAARSIPLKKVEKYLDERVEPGVTRRVHLCKKHYKEFKKASKKDRLTDRLGYQHGGIEPY